MARRNGKSEIETTELDAERELPPSSDSSDDGNSGQTSAGRAAGAESELQKVTAERDTLLDRLARAQAEFDNARKRAAREQQEYREYAQADAIKALLPILDSFERALWASPPDNNSQNSEFRNGVDLIYKQLLDALSKLGLRPIPAKGNAFDPRLHEAIEMVDTDEADDQTVIEELQRGYKLKERMLRPAMVKVARNARQES
ncbi:MAG: nucleotide exchange factor GrpE [Terriglobales bacterium]